MAETKRGREDHVAVSVVFGNATADERDDGSGDSKANPLGPKFLF